MKLSVLLENKHFLFVELTILMWLEAGHVDTLKKSWIGGSQVGGCLGRDGVRGCGQQMYAFMYRIDK